MRQDGRGERYKWTVLINTTIGTFMATIDASIVLISLPAIFRGIDMNPLTTSNTSYLLWMLMGYMVVTAVLAVSFGRIGDTFGRVKMYNLGFAIFTLGSLAASLTYFHGVPAAVFLIAMRIVQGIGGAITAAGLSPYAAALVAGLPPVSVLFAAFLGYNPMRTLLGPALGIPRAERDGARPRPGRRRDPRGRAGRRGPAHGRRGPAGHDPQGGRVTAADFRSAVLWA